MARSKPWGVDDELWAVIEPLLPKVERRARHPGRKWHPARMVFQGLPFVLRTGTFFEHLPQELGYGSGYDLLAPSGLRPRSGAGCMRCSWPSSAARTPWTSPGRRPTAHISER